MDLVSPELALVDPVLQAEARRLLPDPPDCLAPRSRAPAEHAPAVPRAVASLALSVSCGAATVPVTGRHGSGNSAFGWPAHVAARLPVPVESAWQHDAPAPRRAEPARPSLLGVLAVLLVALVVGSPALELIPGGSDDPSFATTDERVGAPTPSTPQESPAAAEAPVSAVLRWPSVDGADLYDVVLWRAGRRYMDVWPHTNSLEVRGNALPDGRTLEPGRYQWFVFAGFVEGGTTRFGRSLANGELRISGDVVSP